MVSGYLPLKRKSGSYWAPCPFHEEKTASFHVVPDRQFYKCFGCGAAGGVIDFVIRHEKAEFGAAVEILAEKAGIKLRYTGGSSGGPGRDEILRTLDWAAGFYRKQLLAAPGAAAREFLRRRGVSEETEEAWKLGWAPEGWDSILRKARADGVDVHLLVAAGLVGEKSKGDEWYDRFRARVMFPIFDARGKTIAFGARTLKDENPKFLNSPETSLFSKGRNLFGLHAAREAAEESRTLYIVEGYLDVIVPWQAGVRGLVATLGTALTRDHLKLLKRHADRVVLVFDSDAAGKKAAERGLDLLLGEDMDLFVAELPPDQDADDVIQRSGPDGLKKVLDRPKEVFAFLVEALSARIDASTATGKTRIVGELLDRIATVPNPVKQAFLIKEVAAKFGMSEGLLTSRLRREEPAPAAPKPKRPETATEVGRELLSLIVGGGETAVEVRHGLPLDRWPDAVSASVAAKAFELIDRTGAASASDLLALVREEAAAAALSEALERAVDPATARKRLSECLQMLGNEEFKKTKAGVLHGDELVAAKRGAGRDARLFPRQRTKEA